MRSPSRQRIVKGAVVISLAAVFGLAAAGGATAPRITEAKTAAAGNQEPRFPVIIDPSDPMSVIYLDSKGRHAGIGDPNHPASKYYRIGEGWHPMALSESRFPKDRYGLVDWAKLVKERLIKPRGAIEPNGEETPPLDMNVLIPTQSDFVNNVVFPHRMHTYWLKCEDCHPKIFIPAKGQNHMTMVGIAQGRWCGRCHGKVAFPLTECNRCHVSPKKKMPTGGSPGA